jgi:hypothetical protein
VKVFGPDGALRRQRYSLEGAEYLLGKKLVIAQRNTAGAITSIWFFGDQPFPHQARHKAGTRYSTEEQIGGFGKMWKHKRKARTSRDIYLAVVTSLISPPEQPTTHPLRKRRQAKSPAHLAA